MHLSLCFLITALVSLNEPSISGFVVDEFTNERIPYAYIQFLDDEGSYITANANGEFQFEAVGNRKSGRLYVRSLGYEEAYLEFNLDQDKKLEIVLKPKPLGLEEVEIIGEKIRSKSFGDINEKTSVDLSTGIQNFGLLFDTRKEKGKLTKIYFSLSSKHGFPEAPILLNVYSFPLKKLPKTWDVLDLNQLKPRHEKPILFEDGEGGWNEFDLEPYSLVFEDAVVLIHFIFPNDDPAYLWEYQANIQGKLFTNKWSGPSFERYSNLKSNSIIPLLSNSNQPANRLTVSHLFRSNRFRIIPAVAIDYDVIK